MLNPYQIVILDYRPNGHIWRHDFNSAGDYWTPGTKASRFARPFKELSRMGMRIKVFVYNSIDEMPEEYRKEQAEDHY